MINQLLRQKHDHMTNYRAMFQDAAHQAKIVIIGLMIMTGRTKNFENFDVILT